MSWLCDVCGYENEFNDESQPTTCLCCGEPAPESKIIQARRELEAYHREEDRRAQIEEQRQKQEQQQQKVDRLLTRITLTIKVITAVVIAMAIIAFLWIGLSLYSEGTTISDWNTQMHSNINAISLTGRPDKVKNRLVDIGFIERIVVPIEEAGRIVVGQMSACFSDISANITQKPRISSTDNLSSIEGKSEPASVQKNHLSANGLTIFENVGSDLNQVGGNAAKINLNISNSCSNIKSNLPVFGGLAKDNVQELINTITRKEGDSDD